MGYISSWIAVAVISSLALVSAAAPSPINLQSDLTILVENDLEGSSNFVSLGKLLLPFHISPGNTDLTLLQALLANRPHQASFYSAGRTTR